MSNADNLAIKIPETHYVGYQKREGDQVPLGFMTPDGTDKAAEKRKATVDKWANGYGYSSRKQATLPASTFDNKPMVGFKVARLVSGGGRGWDARSDAWRIEDPRGFELEIGSGNFQEILAISTLEKGEILEECIWGRLGNNNILIPVASDVYVRATANTERMNKTASVKDLKPGNRVVFKNGDEAIYYGRVHAYGYDTARRVKDDSDRYNRTTVKLDAREFKTYNKKKAIHAYIPTKESYLGLQIMLRDDMKLAEIHEDNNWTADEGCDKLNEILQAHGSNKVDHPNKWGYTHSEGTQIIHFSPTPIDTLSTNVEIVDVGDVAAVDAIMASSGRSYENKFVVKYGEEYCEVSLNPHWKTHSKTLPFDADPSSYGHYVACLIDTQAFLNDKHIKNITVTKKRSGGGFFYSGNGTYTENLRPDWTAATAADLTFYRLVLKFKSFSGKEMFKDITYR